MEIGTIEQSYIDKNRDGDDDVLLHKTQMVEDDDIQTVEQVHIPGFQYHPPDGSRGFIGRITNAWKKMRGVFDLVSRITLNPGEIVLYSSSGGSVAASLKFTTNGEAILTAPGGFSVIADTEITGDLDVDGDQTNTGDIDAEGDITADYLSSAITLLTHYHQGNLGYPTGTPIQSGGGTTPGTPPTTNAAGDIIDGSSLNLSTHKHSQGNDSNGDTEVDTGGPHA